VAYAAKKQAKIYDNQLKQCRRRGRGHFKRDAIRAKHYGRTLPRRLGREIERRKKNEQYSVAVDGCQTMERHTTTNQKWLTQ
jgi:hypothetical protein